MFKMAEPLPAKAMFWSSLALHYLPSASFRKSRGFDFPVIYDSKTCNKKTFRGYKFITTKLVAMLWASTQFAATGLPSLPY